MSTTLLYRSPSVSKPSEYCSLIRLTSSSALDSKTFFSNLQHQEESRLAEQERNIRIEQCTDILGKLQEELVKRADHKSALEGSKEKLRGLRTAVLVETRENRIFDHGMPGAEALLGNQSKLEAKLKEIKETIDKFDPEEDA